MIILVRFKYLYIFLPLSIIFYLLNLKLLCFLFSFLSIIPMSASISYYTTSISNKLGDKIGGMLNSTAGNIPELMICLFALKHKMYDLAKSGLIGSIIGNMLFVLGISIFLGGIKYQEQIFNKNIARTNFCLLFLALTGIIIETIYSYTASFSKNISYLSLGISIILILVYIMGLIFSLVTHRNLFIAKGYNESKSLEDKKTLINCLTLKKSLLLLVLLTLLIALESKLLVNSIEYVTSSFGLSESFIGIIVIPLAGNASEYITAIIMSLKNKISLCIEIAIGSGMQIALFVTPVLVIYSFIIGHTISLVYNIYNITSLIISLCLSFLVFQDGKAYWIEGAILVASYFIIALGYFFI